MHSSVQPRRHLSLGQEGVPTRADTNGSRVRVYYRAEYAAKQRTSHDLDLARLSRDADSGHDTARSTFDLLAFELQKQLLECLQVTTLTCQ